MIAVQELRSGIAFKEDGQLWQVLKYEHIKMGRGSATIKVKVKNLLTGTTLDKSYVNSARVEEIETARKPMQYLYQDGDNSVFMDPRTFDQLVISGQVAGSSAVYLQEGVIVDILFWDEKPLLVELPLKMTFEVAETDPGVKGDSVSNIFKSAKLVNGMTTRVPLFVNQGDREVVDTRDGSYVERAK